MPHPKISAGIPGIADSLQCGLISYIHKTTFEVLTMGDHEFVDNYGDDPWEEDRERVLEEPFAWICISKPTPSEGFKIMADFAENMVGGRLRTDLIDALNRSKPFRNFKGIVESSAARNDWFSFRDAAYRQYVSDAIERALDVMRTDEDMDS